MAPSALLEVSGLSVRFKTARGEVRAVDDIDFSLSEGEVLCVLGESGSGKSVMLRSLMRLLPERTATMRGAVRIDGRDVMAMTKVQLSAFRGKVVSMIFQEPALALDPVFTIGQQISETIERHKGASAGAARRRARELLDLVQIPAASRRLDAYPHELSGGMRQRAMIALALSCDPKVLLADEPTTALDATVQIQILLLLRTLQRELGMGIVFVTHDVGAAVEVSDRIAVMYAGRIVEQGPVVSIVGFPEHPYTKGLLAATVRAVGPGEPLPTIPGSPPDLAQWPSGCAFAPRCQHASSICRECAPKLLARPDGREAACWLPKASANAAE